MANADLENALHHLRVMQDLLAQQRGSGANVDQAQLFAALELLSGSFSRLMTDCLCQQKLAELRGFAHALYSDKDQQRWSRASLTGGEFLRLQMLKSLNALDARIRMLFKIRSAATENKVLPLPRSERARRAARAAKKVS